MMEGWGSGLGSVFKVCLEHGLAEPVIEQVSENIRITVYRRGARPEGGKLPLNDADMKLLEIVAAEDSITIPEIAQKMGVSSPTVNNVIKRLKASGRLSREGSRKTGRWKVLSKV